MAADSMLHFANGSRHTCQHYVGIHDLVVDSQQISQRGALRHSHSGQRIASCRDTTVADEKNGIDTRHQRTTASLAMCQPDLINCTLGLGKPTLQNIGRVPGGADALRCRQLAVWFQLQTPAA